jgi:hypothetical protein
VSRAPVAVAVAVAAALAVAAAPDRASARDAQECRGLQVCIPVAGPWVVVPEPARGARLSSVQYQLPCRKGSVVGGTDALVSDPWLDLAFLGSLGSPLAPGITAHANAVFIGTYVGPQRRPSTFRPYLGCVPASGGGGRSTVAFPQLRPGQPLIRRARNVVVPAAFPVTATETCGGGERLVGSGVALAFRGESPPAVEAAADVHAKKAEFEGRVVVTAYRGFAVPLRARVEVQIQALCARRG